MSQQTDQTLEATEPPRAHARMVYLGPVAPHWDIESEFGDRSVLDDFRQRVMARLMLLPPHDPQFRRNRERVVRDAEREGIVLEWDLGVPEEESAQMGDPPDRDVLATPETDLRRAELDRPEEALAEEEAALAPEPAPHQFGEEPAADEDTGQLAAGAEGPELGTGADTDETP